MAELTGPGDDALPPKRSSDAWRSSDAGQGEPRRAWRRPARRFHLLILGGGTAGAAAAETAAALGARVALIARRRLGGDRLAYGAPRAAVIRAARAPGAVEAGDFSAAMDTARRLRAQFATTVDAERLRQLGVQVIFGEGRFVASDAIEVDGSRLHFRRALIATGARPKVWPIPGLEDLELLTLATVFDLEHRPRRLGVLGGGERACELAQACQRLGSEVHLFERRARVLTRCAPDAAALVESALRRDGVHLHLGHDIRSVQQTAEEKVVHLAPHGRGIAVDELLLADGRTPNVTGLGFEAAGVEYDLSGIEVDRRLRTSNRRIFAVGDAVSDRSPAHADDAARAAVYNALLRRRLEAPRATPRAVFTQPEIAWVGIDADQAEAAGSRIETLQLTTGGKAPLQGEPPAAELLRIYLARRSGRVLGGVLVADGAAESIAPLALATRRKLRMGSFAVALSPYGARTDIYHKVALEWQKTRRRRPLPRAIFELLLRLSP